jgi:hypothetical protein
VCCHKYSVCNQVTGTACNFLPDEILNASVGSVNFVKQRPHRDSAVGIDGGGGVVAHRVSVDAYVIS